jgi:hypothetical protein
MNAKAVLLAPATTKLSSCSTSFQGWRNGLMVLACCHSVHMPRGAVKIRIRAIVGQFECGDAILPLASSPRLSDIATMAERANFTIQIEADAERPWRHRWAILENGKHRDRSTYSYATKYEALKDAEKFLDKLNEIWGADHE